MGSQSRESQRPQSGSQGAEQLLLLQAPFPKAGFSRNDSGRDYHQPGTWLSRAFLGAREGKGSGSGSAGLDPPGNPGKGAGRILPTQDLFLAFPAHSTNGSAAAPGNAAHPHIQVFLLPSEHSVRQGHFIHCNSPLDYPKPSQIIYLFLLHLLWAAGKEQPRMD